MAILVIFAVVIAGFATLFLSLSAAENRQLKFFDDLKEIREAPLPAALHVYRRRSAYVLFTVLGVLLFVLGSVGAVAAVGRPEGLSGTLNSCIVLLVSLYLILHSIGEFAYTRSTPYLQLDEGGITFKTNARIPWADISDIRLDSYLAGRGGRLFYFVLRLTTPHALKGNGRLDFLSRNLSTLPALLKMGALLQPISLNLVSEPPDFVMAYAKRYLLVSREQHHTSGLSQPTGSSTELPDSAAPKA